MSQEDVRLVRIKPYNPKKGHLVRVYTVGGSKFKEEAGWYTFSGPLGLQQAAALATLTQSDSDPDSELVFDVCTVEEALKLQGKEQGKAARATVQDANTAPASTHKDQPKKRTVQGALAASNETTLDKLFRTQPATPTGLVLPTGLPTKLGKTIVTGDTEVGTEGEDSSLEQPGEDDDFDLTGDTDFGKDSDPVPSTVAGPKKLGPKSRRAAKPE
jgi:hypothetical protein